MTEIRARVLVGRDHRISGTAPAAVPPGEHEITIKVAPPLTRQRPGEPFEISALPTHDLGVPLPLSTGNPLFDAALTEKLATTTTIELTVPDGFAIDSFQASPGWRRTVKATGSGESQTIQQVTAWAQEEIEGYTRL